MPAEIREPVKVMAVFDAGVRPVKFKWKGRVYPVKEITHTWRSKEGSASLIHFCVTDGAGLFELAYDTSAVKWSLERVQA
ncbi:MAG: hypothetical protein AAB307_00780 [Deltaproteobacteria bacterium]